MKKSLRIIMLFVVFVVFAQVIIFAQNFVFTGMNNPDPDRNHLRGVYFYDKDHGMAVGKNNTVIQCDYDVWSQKIMSTPANTLFHCVYLSASGQGWVGGGDQYLYNVLLKYDGSSFQQVNMGTISSIMGFFFYNENNGYAICDKGEILKYDGISWTQVAKCNGAYFYSIFGDSNNNIYVGGFDIASPHKGILMKYDGTVLTEECSLGICIYSVWCSDGNLIYLACSNGLYSYNKVSGDTIFILGGSFNKVIGLQDGSILFGDNDVVFRYNGAGCDSLSNARCLDISMADANNIYIVGWSGNITHLQITSSISLPSIVEKFSVYPNPCKESTVISLDLKNPEKISVSLFNLFGQKVKDIYSGFTGNETLDIDTKELKSGIYLIKVNVGNNQFFEKLVVQ
jgi:hypothetical protein